MKIDPALLEFNDGYTGYCGARGHDRSVTVNGKLLSLSGDRVEDHDWEVDGTDLLFCPLCGAMAYRKPTAIILQFTKAAQL